MSKEGNVDNGLRKILFLPGSRRNGEGAGTRPTSPALVSLRPIQVLVSIFFHAAAVSCLLASISGPRRFRVVICF